MPRVPLADGPQVRSTVSPTVDQARVAAPDMVMGDFTMRQPALLQAHDASVPDRTFTPLDPFHSAYQPIQPLYADTSAENEAGWAKAFGAAGDQIADITNRVQLQANALQTDAAVNKAKEAALRLAYDKDSGFTSLKGYDALNRPDGKPLADEFAGKFDDVTKDISTNFLKNDQQRRAFAEQALNIRGTLYGQATQHETQEFRNYNLSTQEGTIKTETDNVGLNYRNPDAVGNSVERIKGAVAEQGMALGKSAVWIEAAQKDAVSKAHSMALESAMEDGNIVFADAYMKAHKGEMNPGDIMRVRGAITKEMDGRIGLDAARDAIAKTTTPALATTDLDRLHNIVAGLESHGQETNPDGSRVTSPKGAKGVMQVMPKTGADPGLGVKPSNGTPQDDARMGRDYLDALVRRYNGDVPQALGAYNWGMGNVDQALKDGRAQGKAWLQLAPAETQAYVTNGLAQLANGSGKPPAPTLEDAIAALDKDPRVNQSPARLDYARREVTARFEAMTKAKKSSEDDSFATALQQVEANGGNYMALTPSVRAAIPADKIDTVMNFADKVRKGNTVTNLAVYQKLTDDNYLKSLGDSQFYGLRPELDPSDFQHFAEQRAKLLDPKQTAANGPGELNTPAIHMVIENRLQMLGINPTPKASDAKAMEQVGAVNKFVREQILLGQQQHGKKFNDAETEAFIDRLFAKSVPFRSTVLGITTGHDAMRMLGMSPDDVPSDARQKITDAFKKRGVPSPSDADILTAYWRTRTLAGQ